MDAMIVRPTSKTPGIDFNPAEGLLEIKGTSTPEDSRVFYKPIIAWGEEYANNPPEKTTVDFRLEYFDTSSSKGLLDFLKRLKLIQEKEKKVEVIWHYSQDDEDILEAGENFEHITGIPFTMAPH
jgi:hypothetical protein